MRVQVVLIVVQTVALAVLLLMRTPGAGGDAAAPPADVSAARQEPAEGAAAPAIASSTAAPTPRELAAEPLGVLLAGLVHDADGQPIEHANISLTRDAVERRASSGASGAYAVVGLGAGEWRVACQATGYVAYEGDLALDAQPFPTFDVTLRKACEVKVKLALADGSRADEAVLARAGAAPPVVVASDAPLPGSLPPAERHDVGFAAGSWSSAWSSEPGSEVLRAAGYFGVLRLDREPPLHVALLLRNSVLATQALASGQREVTFTISPDDLVARLATVTLRLLDGQGAPLPNVALRVMTASGGGGAGKTGDDGRATLSNVLPGFSWLEVLGQPKLERPSLPLRCAPGQRLDLGDVTLPAALTLEGEVVDAEDRPVAEASVQWTALDGRFVGAPLMTRRSARVEAGKFTLPGCGPHRYMLLASDQLGRSGFTVVDATLGKPPPVRLALGARTTVDLHTSAGFGTGYAVTFSRGAPVAVAWLGGDQPRDRVILPEGDYLVEVHDRASDQLVRSFAWSARGAAQRLVVP